MPGFDRARIVGIAEEDLEEFICGICLEVFIRPTVTECCGQTYCYDCVKEWLDIHKTCPNDRAELRPDQLKSPTRIVVNLLNNMKIKCDFHHLGCDSVLKLKDLVHHRDFGCEFNPERKCEKCDLVKLNHTDQVCCERLFEKFNELSRSFENKEKERTEADNKLCQILTKIKHLESKCSDYEGKIAQLEQANHEMQVQLRRNTNPDSFNIYSRPAIPQTPWTEFIQKICNLGLFTNIVENNISPVVEYVMSQVDRAYYCRNDPYSDKSQMSNDSYIKQPSTHAQFLELIRDKLFPGAKALDVGSGSGYITACMAYMVGVEGKVIGIDRKKIIIEESIRNIDKNFPRYISSGRIRMIEGDGRKGFVSMAPYDVIHVGASAVTIPLELIDQLKPGGRMLIPLGTMVGNDIVGQRLVQIDKMPDGTITRRRLFDVHFGPLSN